MSEGHKRASLSAIQVKNPRKTISIEGKLDVISRIKSSEGTVDKRPKVRFVHINKRKIRDNADRIIESAKSVSKVFVQQKFNRPI
jgi:hypothetical protein